MPSVTSVPCLLEITGITDWKDGAVLVEFVGGYRWEGASPQFLWFAGKVFKPRMTGKAYFRRWDDGWRIQE
jgi:hypothetical protein